MSLMRFCHQRFPGEYLASRKGCVLPPLPRPSHPLPRPIPPLFGGGAAGLDYLLLPIFSPRSPRREENDGLGKSSEERKEREDKRRG
jgi:hypothetical protein